MCFYFCEINQDVICIMNTVEILLEARVDVDSGIRSLQRANMGSNSDFSDIQATSIITIFHMVTALTSETSAMLPSFAWCKEPLAESTSATDPHEILTGRGNLCKCSTV
jgi:hypothetical protein